MGWDETLKSQNHLAIFTRIGHLVEFENENG